MKQLFHTLIALFIAMTTNAQAAAPVLTGYDSSVVISPGTLQLRVKENGGYAAIQVLTPVPFCSSNHNNTGFAFIDEQDDMYATFVGELLLAKALVRGVSIYVRYDTNASLPSLGSQCRIVMLRTY